MYAGLLPDEPYEKQLKKLRNREMNPGQPWIHEKRLVTNELPITALFPLSPAMAVFRKWLYRISQFSSTQQAADMAA